MRKLTISLGLAAAGAARRWCGVEGRGVDLELGERESSGRRQELFADRTDRLPRLGTLSSRLPLQVPRGTRMPVHGLFVGRLASQV